MLKALNLTKLNTLISNKKTLIILYLILSLGITIRAFLLGVNDFGTHQYTFYNNYIIFKNSFLHLINNQNPYALYLNEQWDLYKYSPAFAVFMGLFAFLPNFLGLFLWNSLNNFVLLFGIYSLKLRNSIAYGLAALFVMQDLLNATINAQSNALIAGLLLLGYSSWYNSKNNLALLYISLAVFIKPFAIVFFLFWIFFDNKIKNLVKASAIFIFLIICPVIFVGFDGLIETYKNWFTLLGQDHDESYGLSFMGFLYKTIHLEGHKNMMVLTSAIIILLPLLRTSLYKSIVFQLYYAAFLLLWMVVFNHKAESPTFIIAVVGVAIWYFSDSKTKVETALLFFVLLITQFNTSDIFPSYIRNNFFKPYEIKVVPCIIVWFVIAYKLLFENFKTSEA